MANKIAYVCVIATLCTLTIISITNAQEKPVPDVCLSCICEATSGCNQTGTCNGDTCGLFRMTRGYWSDGGKLTVNGEDPASETAYPNCANDLECADKIVQNYMAKYSQDCNGDNKVDCLDYAAIHKLGPYGCKGGLSSQDQIQLTTCVANFSQRFHVRSNFQD